MKKIDKKVKIILLFIFLIILLILLLKTNRNKIINRNIQSNFTFNVAGIDITSTDEVLGKLNKPQLGAGMIPIKYENGIWQIVSENNDNNEWYDYSKGRMATVMLSNGYYLSEEQQNMDNHTLASRSIGNDVLPEQLGTIYVWLPRFVKIGDDDYRFLKDYSVINYDNYTTPTCFLYKKDLLAQYAFKGIWVEKTTQNTQQETNKKISQMNKESNEYGLIKNEIVEMYTKDAIDSVKLYQSNFKKQKSEQKIDDIENRNRTMIRILSTNNYVPLTINAQALEKVAYITTYSDYGIEKIFYIDKATNTAIPLQVTDGKTTMAVPEDGKYTFVAIDNVGNIQSIVLNTAIGIPDLTGFRVDTTYIVAYGNITDTENYTVDTSVPIREILADNYKVDKKTNALMDGEIDFTKLRDKLGDKQWFSYGDSVWANIVVRNNANEAYFVWIPRYLYQLNNEEETTNIKFVNVDNQDSSGNTFDMTEWTLPDAFTWQTDEEKIQLTGFWTSKYELSNATTFSLTADVSGGMQKIIVNNIKNNTGLANCTYEFYVYKAGVDKTLLYVEDYVKDWKVAYISGVADYTFKDISTGEYDVRIILNSNGIYAGEIWKYNIPVDKAGVPNEPDLTGFRLNTTYAVTYVTDSLSDASLMDASIPVSDILKDVEINPDLNQNTVKNASIDLDKVNEKINSNGRVWYDYSNSIWANIVVRNNGGESYYTWIPRYIYKLNTGDNLSTNTNSIANYETTEIKFVTKDEDISDYIDSGWILPDAFTWQTDGGVIQLNGFWASKYELSSFTNFNLSVPSGGGVSVGLNKMSINNITDSLGIYKYKLYLFEQENMPENFEYYAEPQQDPERQLDDGSYYCDNRDYVRFATLSGSATNRTNFTGLNAGTYALRIVSYDNRGYYRGEKWYKNLVVEDAGNLDEIITVDLTGFRTDTTYLVTYKIENGNATVSRENIPISSILDGNVVNKSKLQSVLNDGEIWYDYKKSIWANIVTKNNNKTAYFVYTPRYVYKLNNIAEETEIKFVTKDENLTKYTEKGWIFPDAFTWQTDNGVVQLHGFWASKYELSG